MKATSFILFLIFSLLSGELSAQQIAMVPFDRDPARIVGIQDASILIGIVRSASADDAQKKSALIGLIGVYESGIFPAQQQDGALAALGPFLTDERASQELRNLALFAYALIGHDRVVPPLAALAKAPFDPKRGWGSHLLSLNGLALIDTKRSTEEMGKVLQQWGRASAIEGKRLVQNPLGMLALLYLSERGGASIDKTEIFDRDLGFSYRASGSVWEDAVALVGANRARAREMVYAFRELHRNDREVSEIADAMIERRRKDIGETFAGIAAEVIVAAAPLGVGYVLEAEAISAVRLAGLRRPLVWNKTMENRPADRALTRYLAERQLNDPESITYAAGSDYEAGGWSPARRPPGGGTAVATKRPVKSGPLRVDTEAGIRQTHLLHNPAMNPRPTFVNDASAFQPVPMKVPSLFQPKSALIPTMVEPFLPQRPEPMPEGPTNSPPTLGPVTKIVGGEAYEFDKERQRWRRKNDWNTSRWFVYDASSDRMLEAGYVELIPGIYVREEDINRPNPPKYLAINDRMIENGKLRLNDRAKSAFAELAAAISRSQYILISQNLRDLERLLGSDPYVSLIVHLHRFLSDPTIVNPRHREADYDLFLDHLYWIRNALIDLEISKQLKQVSGYERFSPEKQAEIRNQARKSTARIWHSPVLSSYGRFEPWFARIRFEVRVRNGRLLYELATGQHLHEMRQGTFTPEDREATLFPPEMMLFLSLPENLRYLEQVCYELSFFGTLNERLEYLKGLTNPEDLPGFLRAARGKFSSVAEMRERFQRFPSFSKAKNWNLTFVYLYNDEKEMGHFWVLNNREGYIERRVFPWEAHISGCTYPLMSGLDEMLEAQPKLEARTVYKNPPPGEQGYTFYIGAAAFKPELLASYPDQMTILHKIYDGQMLSAEVDAWTVSILKSTNLVVNTQLNNVDIRRLAVLYLTIIEPNLALSPEHCLAAYIGAQFWLDELGRVQDLSASDVKRYNAAIIKLIWPGGRPASREASLPNP